MLLVLVFDILLFLDIIRCRPDALVNSATPSIWMTTWYSFIRVDLNASTINVKEESEEIFPITGELEAIRHDNRVDGSSLEIIEQRGVLR